MSILNNFPHRCTIRRRVRTAGELGGNVDSFLNEQTSVLCWEQNVSHRERSDFEKRGMFITTKIFFTADPSVGVRHQILVTERNGTTISDPVPLDVLSESLPDASAGRGVVYKVYCTENTGEDN